MLTNQEIFVRHPELMELREFKTNEEIIQAFRNGGTMWSVYTYCGGPAGVSSKEVVGTGTYDNPSSVLHGKAVYYHTTPWSEKPLLSFVEDLQNRPAKAVFTSNRLAERYSNAAHYAFASDPAWQADVAHNEALAEYDVMVDDEYDEDKQRYEDDEALRSMDLA